MAQVRGGERNIQSTLVNILLFIVSYKKNKGYCERPAYIVLYTMVEKPDLPWRRKNACQYCEW